MNRTKIEWCDYTWNPFEGCSHVSPGCDHCYAAALARRFERPWGYPIGHEERMEEPMRIEKPSIIFVCSTSDLFHVQMPSSSVHEIIGIIQKATWHRFIVLTKRPENIAVALRGISVPGNLWIGVSAEDQYYFNMRWNALCSAVPRNGRRLVSIEPMLGHVEVKALAAASSEMIWSVPDWVICGPENGAGKRPCSPAWIEALAAECAEMGVPFFDKRPGATKREWCVGLDKDGGRCG